MRRPSRTTFAPARAHASALARPKPPAAPVMSTTRSRKYAGGTCQSAGSRALLAADMRGSGLLRFLDHALELTAFVQFERDVAAADQFAVDEQLREGRPVGIMRQVRAHFGIFEH